MSNFINGTEQIVSILYKGFYLPIGCLTSNNWEESVEMLPTTTRDNPKGWKSSVPTNQQFSISFSGLIDSTDRNGTIITYKNLEAIKRNRETIQFRIEDLRGLVQQGYGHITLLNNSAEIEANISFSGTIVGYGEPISGLVSSLFSVSGYPSDGQSCIGIAPSVPKYAFKMSLFDIGDIIYNTDDESGTKFDGSDVFWLNEDGWTYQINSVGVVISKEQC